MSALAAIVQAAAASVIGIYPDDSEWWHDPYSGYPCFVRRGLLGVWCGYIAVPPEHPWFGRSSHSIPAHVHGDITFARGTSDGKHWFIGFDCAHGYDAIPGMEDIMPHATQRCLFYVKAECLSLAMQARLETRLPSIDYMFMDDDATPP